MQDHAAGAEALLESGHRRGRASRGACRAGPRGGVGGRIEALIGDSDPVEAVRQLLASTDVDEVIVSTLPQRVSKWLHRDVPSRIQALGLPVTVVTAEQSSRHLIA